MNYKQSLQATIDGFIPSIKASKKEVSDIVLSVGVILLALLILVLRIIIVLTFPISVWPLAGLFLWFDRREKRKAAETYDELLQQHNWNPHEH